MKILALARWDASAGLAELPHIESETIFGVAGPMKALLE
jgi:hypothetical protein